MNQNQKFWSNYLYFIFFGAYLRHNFATMKRTFDVGTIRIHQDELFLISGPCVIEERGYHV